MRWTWILLAVLTLGGCATGPRPAAHVAPKVLRLYVNGAPRCACVPVPDGCYTAKHCLTGLPARAVVSLGDGTVVTRWTLDPTRDLAHLPYGADPAQAMGAPYEHAPAVWAGYRSGVAVHRREGAVIGPVYDRGKLEVQRQTFDVWCYGRDGILGGVPRDGDLIHPGDSGGGFYVDGVLVGILSLYDPMGCGAWTVRVP